MSAYRILVTGSRTWWDYAELTRHLNNVVQEHGGPGAVIIMHGACPRGADEMADRYARACAIKVERYPAKDFGPWPACGPLRNRHMASLGADVCLAFIEPCTKPTCRKPKPHDSHGTAGTVELCEAAGIPVRPFRAWEVAL